MAKLLDGKLAVVTGGGQGLGSAIALALASDGARVLIVSRDAAKARASAERIAAAGGEAVGIDADITLAAGVDRVVAEALDRLGGLDILVNNAGTFLWKGILETTRAEWEHSIATNLSAPFHLTQSAARVMMDGGGGSIINIASIHAHFPEPEVAAHASAKAGLLALTAAAAAALRPHDVRVNAICPGAIESDSADRHGMSPRARVTQGDVASLVVYLASDLARTVTGAVIDLLGSTQVIIRT